jgi:uncharacterized protein YutE (UPF0331/DUF86 family)
MNKLNTRSKGIMLALLKTYALIAALSAIILTSYTIINETIITNGKYNLSWETANYIQISFILASVAALTFVLYILLKDNRRNQVSRVTEELQKLIFIEKWINFEEICNTVIVKSNKTINSNSFLEVLAELREMNVITDSESHLLSEIMQARNIVVHRSKSMPIEVIEVYAELLEKTMLTITNRINR